MFHRPTQRNARMARLAMCGAAAVVLAVGCGSSSSKLDALRDDPMATVELTTADEQRRSEHNSGETFGKPNAAVLQIAFTPMADASFDDVVAEAVGAAESTGWSLRERSPNNSYLGVRVLDDHKVTLEIFVADEASEVIVQLSSE